MARIEIRKHTVPHETCGGEIEIRIDHKKKRVTSVCLKCRKGSIVEKGKVLVDGEVIE